MSAPTLSPLLTAAVQDRTSGATGVARQVLDGLAEFVHDPPALRAVVEPLPGLLPGYASMWHIARAANSADPGPALREIRDQLDRDVERSVATASRLMHQRGGWARTAPSSALVKAVVADLPAGTVDVPGTEGLQPVTGLAGADAISPTRVLNIKGTLALARSVPTVVVTTSLKLVPESVFGGLGSPLFERIPLEAFWAVVLDGELLTPAEVARRAAQLHP
ncbi:hypothetical protein KZZ52_10875 [Dactylosporangium sp. AC04546]|uniref:hypothetical protein n=1 Tax=Dactylosporangium sp. AC04546 TaxID=2862460 RepID=UPI001EDE0437|nr:hypothetical protein [Dactylosporangium sp. AC04546]WVK85859.1 hypothetical protein KZZ52_10875 [Dactylosporangium sp. AC04546]